MENSVQQKVSLLAHRYLEIQALLSQSEIINDQNRFRELSKEYKQIEPIVKTFQRYERAQKDCENAEKLMREEEGELKILAQEEFNQTKADIEKLEQELFILLLPIDPNDEKNVFLEIRAGTGGNEAAIFAGDLFRMYSKYAETKGWTVEIISQSDGEHGGYKEIIARLVGENVYSSLKFESGAHRVQRVPDTEAQGRIHTSTCTVAILPEAEEIGAIEINPSDLRVDTFRASGAGGQHVNRTDSAVRLTHLPSGLVVECQDERSQHKNRARAMSLLRSRLLSMQRDKQAAERAETRRNLVGTGDRSERIRTYNFPQGRVTDHRINLTLYKLDQIMEGVLDALFQPLMQAHQADLISEALEK